MAPMCLIFFDHFKAKLKLDTPEVGCVRVRPGRFLGVQEKVRFFACIQRYEFLF